MRKAFILCFVFISLSGMSGCAYRPITIDSNQIFLGAFKSKNELVKNCQYNEIEGVGLKVGVGIVGVGYFERKVIKVINSEGGYCENDFFEVYTGSEADKEASKL
jgi:hypothetical protein